MDITPVIPKNKKIITGYGDGSFKINNEPFSGNLIIHPDAALAWDVQNGVINTESLSVFFKPDIDIELLIIGCGTEHMMLPLEISKAFRSINIKVEIMTTGAACRTYNVLLSEGRQVAAALIAI